MADKQLSALSIALIDDQQIVWARGFGLANKEDSTLATAETIYRVGSVSKLFTDIGIMQLVERGELDLDAPIQRYLPELRPRNAFGKPITLRQMMSHRSGLVREPPVGHYFDDTSPSLAATVASLNSTSLVYEPETRTKYSNAAIAVVGYVLERTKREAFASYMKRSVLDPFGLEQSSFEPTPAITQRLAKAYMWGVDRPPFDAPTFMLGTGPAGNLYSSVIDLGSFLSAIFAGGKVLRPETLQKMWSPQFAKTEDSRSFGLGFALSKLDGHRRIGHGGAVYGFATELEALPDQKLGVVVATTLDVANSVTSRIAEASLRAMLAARDGKPTPELPATGPILPDLDALTRTPVEKPYRSPARFDGLIGEYGWDHNTLYIYENEGRLHALIEWFFAYPLEEISRNVFAFPRSGLYDGERLIFTRDRSGRATQVEAASVVFKRRAVGPEVGSAQLRIKPQRPVDQLRREALAAAPPTESGDFRPPDLVDVATLDPTIKLDIRYASSNNFLGTPFYSSARVFLQRPAAEALLRAHRSLREQGYGLLIHDAYRPWYVTKIFWDATPVDMKWLVADPSQGSRHNRGSAVDLALYELSTGRPVQMVGTYDEASPRSFPNYPGGMSLQRWHRALLRRAMESQGYKVYDAEWWHFDHEDWRKYPIANLTFEQLSARGRH